MRYGKTPKLWEIEYTGDSQAVSTSEFNYLYMINVKPSNKHFMLDDFRRSVCGLLKLGNNITQL